MRNLGENQGGRGRHKCTICAFKIGFNEYNIASNLFKKDSAALIKKVPAPIVNIDLKKIDVKSSRTTKKETDYLEKEINNRNLGLSGEEAVMNYENERLRKLNIAKSVRHISKELGDSEGYDILFYDENGEEIFIEVKTTRLPESRAFFITKNELEFSKKHSAKYLLYRLFDFNSITHQGNFFILIGDMNTVCALTPIVYEATLK